MADLYLRRGRTPGRHDAEVLDLAHLTGRSPASISRRLGNFDGTEYAGRGLKPVTGEGLRLFRLMQGDPGVRQQMIADARDHLQSRMASNDRERVTAPARLVDPEDFSADNVEFETAATVRRLVRAEADLVRRFRAWLDPKGDRLRGVIIPVGRDHLRADLFDTQLNVLIEAKGAATRQCIRHAVGQLVDYRRYISPRPRLAALLPIEPSEDLAAIPREVGIDLIWAIGEDFEDSTGGELIERRRG